MSGLYSLQSLLAPQSTMGSLYRQPNSLAALAMTNAPAIIMPPHWIVVAQRFAQFHHNLALTPQQCEDGYTKCGGVVSTLNRAYYGSNSVIDNSFLVGSWLKNTAIRPPRDVDVYFLLPDEVFYRFQGYTWARQSALLQEVKDKLRATYHNTDMSGDGQVVVVNFGTYSVEVVPAFALAPSGYLICDTNNGGSYKKTDPWAEANYLDAADSAAGGNVRPLIRMLKAWQTNCSVEIKSFHLDLLAAEFLAQSQWRLNGWFYFDWITRDFFAFLYLRANGAIVVPGTFEKIYLGNAWQSRAESAYYRAVKACDHEYNNQVAAAGDEWQKIFGSDIPRTA